MKTVHEVSKLTGVSVRTLHYYDAIHLLPPSKVTEAGYRLYDDDALCRLQSILLFRELQFSLKDIAAILQAPDFDRQKALEQQIALLELQKKHIADLITFARGIQQTGVNQMDFTAFDKHEMQEYAAMAKAQWGKTEAYKEFEDKTKGRTKSEQASAQAGLMEIFCRFGKIKDLPPKSPAAQALVRELQDYITAQYYTCTKQILQSLGEMYAGGGSMTENIDAAGGPGTACAFQKAIAAYCSTE